MKLGWVLVLTGVGVGFAGWVQPGVFIMLAGFAFLFVARLFAD